MPDPAAQFPARGVADAVRLAQEKVSAGDLVGARKLLRLVLPAAARMDLESGCSISMSRVLQLADTAIGQGNLAETRAQMDRARKILAVAAGPEASATLDIEGRLAEIAHHADGSTGARERHRYGTARAPGIFVRGASTDGVYAVAVPPLVGSAPFDSSDRPAAVGRVRRRRAAPATLTIIILMIILGTGSVTLGWLGVAGKPPLGNGGRYGRALARTDQVGAQGNTSRGADPAKSRATPTADVSAPDAPAIATAGAATPTGAPTEVTLQDHGISVTLTWRDPAAGNVPFIVAGGRRGTPLRALQKVPAGDRASTLYGLSTRYDYCFAVYAIYATDAVATSTQVCTHRLSAGNARSGFRPANRPL